MTPQILSAMVGLFMPYVVEFLTTFLPSKRWVSFTTALAVSGVVGGLTVWVAGDFDTAEILASAGTALIASQGAYNYWFKPRGDDKRIQKAMNGK